MNFIKSFIVITLISVSGHVFANKQTSCATTSGILIIQTKFENPNAEPITQTCMGFVVESDGYILTSYQQIIHPETGRLSGSTKAILQDGDKQLNLPAEIIGVEPTVNFAILKVNHPDPLEAFELNTDREMEKGEPIHAFYPDATGQFQKINGTFGELNQLECYQTNLTATMLRTEIALPKSSIGGPIMDKDGKVFAMHTAHKPDMDEEELAHYGESEVFLLSMDLAMNIYEGVKQRQSMASPWTGFSVRALSAEESEKFPLIGRLVRCGIGIEHVWEGGPADTFGIQEGDILFKMSHYPICTVGSFQRWLYLYGVGHPVKLQFVRQGEEGDEVIVMDYVIEERPAWAKPL